MTKHLHPNRRGEQQEVKVRKTFEAMGSAQKPSR
jgi:hypothetical protein